MSEVIDFQKINRRKGIARLTANYAPSLATLLADAMLDDGKHVDDAGEPMCRPLDHTERRYGAVVSLSEFFAQLLLIRAQFEDDTVPLPGNLRSFCNSATFRIVEYKIEFLGPYKLVVDPKANRRFLKNEQLYVTSIFSGLKIEAVNNPELDECQFWADVFRGFADADPTGVVLRAAGLVLLDHLDDFARALAYHTKKG